MAELDKESSEIAKEKRKQRAKERLNSLSSGDITRGLNSGIKDRKLVSDTYSTQQAKAKVTAKAKAKTKSEEDLTEIKKTTKSSTAKTSSKTTAKTGTKAKETTAKKTKATAVNPEVFEDDILLEQTKKRSTKKQVGNIVVDESALESISTVTTDKRARRNKVIISILIVLIVLIWAAVLIMLLVKPKEEKPNCYMYLGGDSSSVCDLLMNNQSVKSWKAPTGISQGGEYTMDLDLKIKKPGTYTIRFRIEVKNDGVVVENAVTISPICEDFYTDENGVVWYELKNVSGNKKIQLFDSFTFLMDWTKPLLVNLSDENAEVNFYVNVY